MFRLSMEKLILLTNERGKESYRCFTQKESWFTSSLFITFHKGVLNFVSLSTRCDEGRDQDGEFS